MYLLIQNSFFRFQVHIQPFTSHYVSINSNHVQSLYQLENLFTSHYVSINSTCNNANIAFLFNLHPTMYLLIPLYGHAMQTTGKNLHPTMYLLIPRFLRPLACTLHNLHPTMYLLIRYRELHAGGRLLHLHPTMYLLIPILSC